MNIMVRPKRRNWDETTRKKPAVTIKFNKNIPVPNLSRFGPKKQIVVQIQW